MDGNTIPSGPWRGFYRYPHASSSLHTMVLQLSFREGRVSGTGSDDIGRFTVRGRYGYLEDEVYWIKHYIGMHDVYYRGFWERGFIWGNWVIDQWPKGGFKVWPCGIAVGLVAHAEIEEETPLDQDEAVVAAPARRSLQLPRTTRPHANVRGSNK